MDLGEEQAESHLNEWKVESLDCFVSIEWLDYIVELKSCVTVSPDGDLVISRHSLIQNTDQNNPYFESYT